MLCRNAAVPASSASVIVCVAHDVKTTKSPRKVLEYAYLIGGLVLPDYSHRYSRHDFTQPQLFACLALKEFLQLDYRKLAALLQDAGELVAVIGLAKTPHFTTFQKAAQRLLLNRYAKSISTRQFASPSCNADFRVACHSPRSTAPDSNRITSAIITSSVAPQPQNTGKKPPIGDIQKRACSAIPKRT